MLLTREDRQVGAQEKESRLGTPFPGAIHIPWPGQLGQLAPLYCGARRPSAGPGRNPHLLIRSDPSPAGPRDLEAESLVPACSVWGETAGDPLLKGHLGDCGLGHPGGRGTGELVECLAPPPRVGQRKFLKVYLCT